MSLWDNLLLTALTVIPPEKILFEKWTANTTNSIGYDVSTYTDPVETIASIQAHISEKMYQAFGLDMNKNYRLVNIPAHIIGTAEQVTPDRLTFHGKKWIVIKSNNWKIYNGWCKVIVVEDKDYGQNRESNLG